MPLAKNPQHFAKKILNIRAIGSVAGPQPGIDHHAALGGKGHQRVMAFLASMLGIVSPAATLLMTVAGQHARIQVNGPTVSR